MFEHPFPPILGSAIPASFSNHVPQGLLGASFTQGPIPMFARSAAVAVALLMTAPLVALAPSAAGQSLGPNLVVSSVTTSPGDPQPDDQTTVNATIENEGLEDAGNFTVLFELDDGTLATARVDGLDGGQTTTVETDAWEATVGNHTVNVTADADDEVDEADEEDNTETITVEVGPDLITADVFWEPEEPTAGDEVRLKAEIRNRGNANATWFAVDFRVNGTSFWKPGVDGLAAGQSVNVTGPTWDAVKGEHNITVVADRWDDIDESNETNGWANETIQVEPMGPDLIVSVIETPSVAAGGDEVNLTATITNIGDQNASSSEARFFIDGEQHGEDKTVDELAPGQSDNVTSDGWEASFGDHNASVLADAEVEGSLTDEGGDQVDEHNETNNNRTQAFAIGPNVTITRIAHDPPVPDLEEEVTLTATVTNHGTATTGPFDVRFRMDEDTRIGTSTVDDLGPSQSQQLTQTWEATEGTHELTVTADPDDDVRETDETDNEATHGIPVGSAPNLHVPEILMPANVTAGDEVTFLATIGNDGDDDAGPFEVRFEIDNQGILGATNVTGLEAGATTDVTSDTWMATPGQHTIQVRVDTWQNITEADETDNLAAKTIEVGRDQPRQGPSQGGPNLTVEAIERDGDLTPGQEASFVVTVANTGDQPAPATTVQVTMDTNTSLGTLEVSGLDPGQRTDVDSQPWNVTPGDHTVAATVDPDDQVDEAREDDNTQTHSLEVLGQQEAPARPDLAVASLEVSPSDPTNQETTTVTLVVENKGQAAAGPFVAEVVLDDDRTVIDRTLEGLEAGAQTTLTAEIDPLEAGQHTLQASLDPQDGVEEADEQDNDERVTVEVSDGSFMADVPGPGLMAALGAGLVAAVAAAGRRRA